MGKATLGAVIERIAVLVDGGHGRRTAPVALQARCRAERGHVRGIADKGDAVGVSNRKIETDPSNRFQKRALVN